MGVVVPMKILITDSRIADDPVVKEALEKLTKQGHEVIVDDGYRQFDFICGGNCWYLKPELANLFMLAVTNARKIAQADTERVETVKTKKALTKKAKHAKPKVSKQNHKVGANAFTGTATMDVPQTEVSV